MEIDLGGISTLVGAGSPIAAVVVLTLYKVNQLSIDLKDICKDLREHVNNQNSVRADFISRLTRLETIASSYCKPGQS